MKSLDPSHFDTHGPNNSRQNDLPIPFLSVTPTMRPTDYTLSGVSGSSDDFSRHADDILDKDFVGVKFVIDEFGFKINCKS